MVQAKEPFSAMDVFKIAYAADTVVSPDGQTIAFSRYYMDVMTDSRKSDLWLIDVDGENMRQITKDFDAVGPAVFTHDGGAVAFMAVKDETSHIYLQNLKSGKRVELGQDLTEPGNLSFSPDGKWLAFTMPVAYKPETMGEIPAAPDGAEWAEPIIVETRNQYRADGVGYLPFSSHQVFLIPIKGGDTQQLTQGKQDHFSPLTWLPDSSAILLSINIKNNVRKPLDSDIVKLDLKTRQLTAMTSQLGQDFMPKLSPDGKRMAWIVNDDSPGMAHFTLAQLYVANIDGSNVKKVTPSNELGIKNFDWHQDNRRIYIQYEQRGKEVLALLSEDGTVTKLTDELSGWELDQPYVMGQFSASAGIAAFTQGNSTTPSELAVVDSAGKVKVLTDFSHDLQNTVQLTKAKEYTVKSSFDQREIQYWMMLPPNFDATISYPMILQIHGGPWAAYGPSFAANNQLYAAAGYVVVYGNPRGSTGYGEEFVRTTDFDFPGRDYDDLMDIVDSVLEMGFVDEEQLYVTGGSGGGVLTAWIVGKTERFRAAVSVNPVINWSSLVLSTDLNKWIVNNWFEELPWNNPQDYWIHSPLSLVGNVKTPTMIMTGEKDWRTPIWEAEQYFSALQVEGVDTALVRVPGASHWIEYRPSQLLAKVNGILAWFERHSKVTKADNGK
jgi:acylaminoacyl-peptidase